MTVTRPRYAATAALTVVLVGAMAGCGGEEKASPEPSASASTSAAPSPSASPSEATQPQGAHGVTYDIQNWEQYADDPVVRAYKVAAEAIAGSSNQHRLVPGVRRLASKAVLRQFQPQLTRAKTDNWTLASVNPVRIASVKVTGRIARLVACEWRPTSSYRLPSGDFVVPTKDGWNKFAYELARNGGTWRLEALPSETDKTCAIDPPV